jgi:hypothetical protein
MKVVVIHNPKRTDRKDNIENLRKHFPNLEILTAVNPEWESNDNSRCLRGCTASHLIAARYALMGQQVLVLEDDAVLVGEIPDFSKVPVNSGIVVYGADINQAGDREGNGFHQFFAPFWGTQAVLYRPHKQLNAFLIEALTSSSFLPFGFENGKFSPESIIYNAAQRVKLPMCRPSTMSFTTLGDISESFGTNQPPRTINFEVKEKESLLPWSSWDDVFKPWAGKKATLLRVPGNAGDVLLQAATRQLFAHHSITEVSIDQAEVVFYPAGGNVGGRYSFKDEHRAFEYVKVPKVILPQSIEKADPYLDLADVVWLRDKTSLEIYPRAKYAPDLALAYRTALNFPEGEGVDIAFRIDDEAVAELVGGRDPATICQHHYAYLAEAAKSKEIHTNRLHYAITGLILGRDVTLYPNDYHKNRGVWEAELASLGCKWKDSYL